MSSALVASLILFTFDGHPSTSTDKILPLLKQYKIKATFFVLGVRLYRAKNRERLKQIARAGHTIANHLWTHKSPCKLGATKTLWELRRTQKTISRILGRSSSRIYRPPHGHRCYVHQIHRAGFRLQMWTPGLFDLKTPAQLIWSRLKARLVAKKKSIVLIHHDWGKLRFLLRKIYGR